MKRWTLPLTPDSLLHLSRWSYFLMLIDDLLADDAGDYLLEGDKKFGINSECNRSLLDVLAAYTQTENRLCLRERRILNAASIPEDFLKAKEDPDLESSQRKTAL